MNDEQPLQISFAGEAYETFQNLLVRLDGFGVTVTTLDGEVIDGVLAGPDVTDEWGDCILIFPVAEGDDYLTVESYRRDGVIPMAVRVGDVYVH